LLDSVGFAPANPTFFPALAELTEHSSKVPGWPGTFLPIGMDALFGVVVGAVVLLAVKAVQILFRRLLPKT
jgi:hypothetical protein